MSVFAWAAGPLLDGVLRGAALLAVATVVTFALRRRAAAERHAVWFVALVGLLVLPFAGAFAPSWRAPVLPEGLGGVAERLRAIEPAGGAEPIGPVDGAGSIEPAHGSGAAVVPGAPRARFAGGAAVPSEESSARDAAAPASQPGRALRDRAPLGAWLGVGWAAGAALILLSITFDRFRLVHLRRRARQAAPGSRLAREALALADDMEIPARPDVMIGAPGTMPMTWGIRRAVLLLPPEAETWSAARLDAVLRHELAHVRRRDYLTQLVGSLACAVHWFDPLAWFALARLRREREHACDDEVLATGAAPATYAAELLHLARDRRFRGPVPASALAVARPSQLEGRLRAVLDGTRRRARLTRRVLLRTAAAAACGLLPLAVIAPVPTRAAAPDRGSAEGPVHAGPSGVLAADGASPAAEDVVRPRQGAPSSAGRADAALSWLPERVPECLAMDRPASRRVNEHDGVWTISVRAAGCAFDLRLTRARAGGEPLDFDPTFRRIEGMEAGSSMEIRSREEGVGTRRLAAEPDAGGRPVFRYWRDGTAAPFDEEGAEWLAGILVPVLRYTGFRARERTVYILEAAGATGLFQELDHIGSDRVQSLYILAFVDEGAPDAAQLDALLDRTVRLVGSDSQMREVLVGLIDRRPELARPPGWPAFRAAMGTVGSDSDHAALLLGLFDRAGDDPDVAANLLASARSEIGSDDDMALFLNRLAAERPDVLDGPSSREFWACVATIGSDSEMGAALLALADDHANPAVLQRILAAARAHIGSDSDMTSFLVAFQRRHAVEVAGPLREAFRAAARTVSSAAGLEQVLAAPSG